VVSHFPGGNVVIVGGLLTGKSLFGLLGSPLRTRPSTYRRCRSLAIANSEPLVTFQSLASTSALFRRGKPEGLGRDGKWKYNRMYIERATESVTQRDLLVLRGTNPGPSEMVQLSVPSWRTDT
jgi:hypothetical protein